MSNQSEITLKKNDNVTFRCYLYGNTATGTVLIQRGNIVTIAIISRSGRCTTEDWHISKLVSINS